ncbi:MAG: acetylglutamate kinase [bacterium]
MRIKKINPIVIKYGGSLINKPAVQKHFFKNLARLSQSRRVVLVHGGGSEITTYLQKLKIKARFVQGLRFTGNEAMEVVEMVLSGKLNKEIAAKLNRYGAQAVGISGRDMHTVIARPIKKLGRVGTPAAVNPKLLYSLLAAGFLPVVSPVGNDHAGKAININADQTACALAVHLKAKQLIFLTDVPGILDSKGRRIPRIAVRDYGKLISSGVVTGGMIPKLKSAVDAIKHGVREVDILKGGKNLSFNHGTRIL